MYFKGFLSVWLEVQIQCIKKRAVIQIFSTVYFYILTGEPQGLPNHVQYHGVPLSFALYLDRFLLICIKVTNPPKNKGKYSHFKTNTHICNIFSQKISSLLIDQVTIILKQLFYNKIILKRNITKSYSKSKSYNQKTYFSKNLLKRHTKVTFLNDEGNRLPIA